MSRFDSYLNDYYTFRQSALPMYATQRNGQLAMNTLYYYDEALYTQYTGTNLDPFYNDSILGEFFTDLMTTMDKED